MSCGGRGSKFRRCLLIAVGSREIIGTLLSRNRLHGVIFQKTAVFVFTAMRALYLTPLVPVSPNYALWHSRSLHFTGVRTVSGGDGFIANAYVCDSWNSTPWKGDWWLDIMLSCYEDLFCVTNSEMSLGAQWNDIGGHEITDFCLYYLFYYRWWNDFPAYCGSISTHFRVSQPSVTWPITVAQRVCRYITCNECGFSLPLINTQPADVLTRRKIIVVGVI